MSKIAKYYVIGGLYQPRECTTLSQCYTIAARREQAAKVRHGSQAGCDSYVVALHDDGSLSFRGLIFGTCLGGKGFGCGPDIVERVRKHLVEGQYMVDANGIYHTHGYPS